jgi:hypothetical protein
MSNAIAPVTPEARAQARAEWLVLKAQVYAAAKAAKAAASKPTAKEIALDAWREKRERWLDA